VKVRGLLLELELEHLSEVLLLELLLGWQYSGLESANL
jgi:hypothetical protein